MEHRGSEGASRVLVLQSVAYEQLVRFSRERLAKGIVAETAFAQFTKNVKVVHRLHGVNEAKFQYHMMSLASFSMFRAKASVYVTHGVNY